MSAIIIKSVLEWAESELEIAYTNTDSSGRNLACEYGPLVRVMLREYRLSRSAPK